MKIPARLPNSINDLRSGNLFLDADRNVLGIISDGNFISTNPEGWVNVKDFGAVGDGEHDDTEAFKNAINTNKIIYIPEGTYLISETLYIQNYMFGETKHKSIIKKNNNFIGTSLISIGTNINNRKDYINIENLKLDGTDKTVNGIELYGSFAYINNLYIVNCNKGIYGEKAWTNWVTFNNIYNNIIGIHLYDNANNITIFSNEIHHNDSHGIKFEGGFASRIISNGIESNGDYGIYIIGTGTTAIRNLEISNNYTELNGNNKTYAHMIDRNGNEISNIVIQNNFFSDSKGIMINSLQSGLYKHNYGNLYLGWEGYKLQIINSNLTDSTSIDNTKYGGNTKLSSSDGLTVFGRLTAFTLASQEGDPSTLNKIFKIYGRYSVSPYPTMEIGNIKWKWGTSIPSSGTYNQGDIIFNISPTAGDYVGWICVTGGSPGTWKGFGLIET